MTSRKPTPRVEDVGVPDYRAICAATKELLLSLDRTEKFKSPIEEREVSSPPPLPPPLPEPIAESMAETYARLRFEALKEEVTPSFTPRQIADQIRDVGEAAAALERVLQVTGGLAVSALNASEATWSDPLGSSSPTLSDCERMAGYLARLAQAATVPEEVKERKGKAASFAVQTIARRAADDFFKITGKAPSRSGNRGEFPEFLEKLFAALCVAAKAAAFGQDAVDGWTSSSMKQ